MESRTIEAREAKSNVLSLTTSFVVGLGSDSKG